MYEYAATTANATNTITATATDEEMEITITVNGDPHTNETPATWELGENEVVVDVGGLTQYTATVTKTE